MGTHLATAFGTEAIVSGPSVYFAIVHDFVSKFSRVRDENELKER